MSELNRSIFDASMELLCEINNLTLGEKKREYYYRSLKYIDSFEFRKACDVFAARQIFPTVEQILKECGRSAPAFRKDVEAAKERAIIEKNKETLKTAEPLKEDTEYGFWTFYSEIYSDHMLEESEYIRRLSPAIDHHRNKGWTVLQSWYTYGKKEILEGRHSKEIHVYKIMMNCHRNKPGETPRPEATHFEIPTPEQELEAKKFIMQLIKRDIKRGYFGHAASN